MTFRELEHVTDAFIEVEARNIEEAFEVAGRALFDVALHVDQVEPRTLAGLRVEGHDLESLLYNYLEALLLELMVGEMTYSDFRVHIRKGDGKYALNARLKGERLIPEKHKPKVEVKAVTYHLMAVEERKEGTRLRFLLDL